MVLGGEIIGEIKINNRERVDDDDLGIMLWKLESLEEFYPCYKSMMKKESEIDDSTQ